MFHNFGSSKQQQTSRTVGGHEANIELPLASLPWLNSLERITNKSQEGQSYSATISPFWKKSS